LEIGDWRLEIGDWGLCEYFEISQRKFSGTYVTLAILLGASDEQNEY